MSRSLRTLAAGLVISAAALLFASGTANAIGLGVGLQGPLGLDAKAKVQADLSLLGIDL